MQLNIWIEADLCIKKKKRKREKINHSKLYERAYSLKQFYSAEILGTKQHSSYPDSLKWKILLY